METFEIHKKRRLLTSAIAIVLLLLVGVSGLWLLETLIFADLYGFLRLKVTIYTVIAVLTLWAISAVIRHTMIRKIALKIDEQGITDNSSMASVGFIPWIDIVSIKTAANIFKKKLIVIGVKNSAEYIRTSGRMSSSLKDLNKQFGSPVVIIADNLDYNMDELLLILKNRVQ